MQTVLQATCKAHKHTVRGLMWLSSLGGWPVSDHGQGAEGTGNRVRRLEVLIQGDDEGSRNLHAESLTAWIWAGVLIMRLCWEPTPEGPAETGEGRRTGSHIQPPPPKHAVVSRDFRQAIQGTESFKNQGKEVCFPFTFIHSSIHLFSQKTLWSTPHPTPMRAKCCFIRQRGCSTKQNRHKTLPSWSSHSNTRETIT